MMDDSASTPASPLGDDLPPVQPPSAGFVVQLFVVPALIVAAVVGVWALFGRLAAGEQNWQRLVQDLDSPNPLVSKRAMFGLATLLDSDQRRGDAGQHLSMNPQIARALSAQFEKALDAANRDEETLSQQVFLARALGLLDVSSATVPALTRGLDDRHDVEIRKGAVMSLALIAGRALDRREPLGPDAVEALETLSHDSDAALRRPAAFALGLTPSPIAQQRLEVLLEDADQMTSVNAAVALARQKSTAGMPVFVKALSVQANAQNGMEQQETLLIQKNVLKAVAELGQRFDEDDRSRLTQLIAPFANDHREPRIRIEAQGALTALAGR